MLKFLVSEYATTCFGGSVGIEVIVCLLCAFHLAFST